MTSIFIAQERDHERVKIGKAVLVFACHLGVPKHLQIILAMVFVHAVQMVTFDEQMSFFQLVNNALFRVVYGKCRILQRSWYEVRASERADQHRGGRVGEGGDARLVVAAGRKRQRAQRLVILHHLPLLEQTRGVLSEEDAQVAEQLVLREPGALLRLGRAQRGQQQGLRRLFAAVEHAAQVLAKQVQHEPERKLHLREVVTVAFRPPVVTLASVAALRPQLLQVGAVRQRTR